jgi:hypothetical protein
LAFDIHKKVIMGFAIELMRIDYQPRNNTPCTPSQTLQQQHQQLIQHHLQWQNQFMIFAPSNQIAPGNHMEVEEQVENNGMDVEGVLAPK